MFQTHSKLRSTENYVINSHSRQKLCCFCCCSSTIRTASALTKMAFRCKRFYVSLFFQPENMYIYLRTECKPKHAPIDGLFLFYWPSKVQNNNSAKFEKLFRLRRYRRIYSFSSIYVEWLSWSLQITFTILEVYI